jgi:hypothetical protein
MAEKQGATVMYLRAKFQEALPARRQSWVDIIARVLMKWVRGPRAWRRSRWYDSDGAHRGL